MVTAYNIANVKYKQNILRFVPEAVKIFAPNAMKSSTTSQVRL